MITTQQLINVVNKPEYDFLRTNEHLGKKVCLLTVGGSYSYGLEKPDGSSDIDIRGCAWNTKEQILGTQNFEQFINEETDTTIYGFNKFMKLLIDNNPSLLEMCGCKPEHYLYIHPLMQDVINNVDMFLSQRCARTFGGYANQQLRRLENALAHDNYPAAEKEKHLLGSLQITMDAMFSDYGNDVLVYTDPSTNEVRIKFRKDFDRPIRETNSFLSQMTNIVRDYDKLNRRNKKKDDLHLNKHAMHLVRLFKMGAEILESGKINTFREADHDLLMMIRNGFFQKADGGFHSTFFEMVNDLQSDFEYAKQNTFLPKNPDNKLVEEYIIGMNMEMIRMSEVS